jgi:hypothetical protein
MTTDQSVSCISPMGVLSYVCNKGWTGYGASLAELTFWSPRKRR